MAWKFVEQCWRILNGMLGQLWDYLSGDNCLILRPVPAMAARRQLVRCAPKPIRRRHRWIQIAFNLTSPTGDRSSRALRSSCKSGGGRSLVTVTLL